MAKSVASTLPELASFFLLLVGRLVMSLEAEGPGLGNAVLEYEFHEGVKMSAAKARYSGRRVDDGKHDRAKRGALPTYHCDHEMPDAISGTGACHALKSSGYGTHRQLSWSTRPLGAYSAEVANPVAMPPKTAAKPDKVITPLTTAQLPQQKPRPRQLKPVKASTARKVAASGAVKSAKGEVRVADSGSIPGRF
ncbi:hypothetical protein FB451DRAFT_1182382 [Mycena latifolia]|nr:hypothetical protein FB451DRAFT_1182382 [Mycena latifolia]